MELVKPTLEMVPSYVAARERGFPFDINPDPGAVAALTEQIKADPQAFIKTVEDLHPVGRTVTLPDGSEVPRLPQYTRWMWDDEFAGVITFRFQRGTPELPAHVLGHIGYAVVEWKRRLGYAAQALRDILALPRAEGLPYVEVTTNVDNLASQGVILKAGGEFVETYNRPASQGGAPINKYVIHLQ